jgi:hypothetical protein
MLCKYAGLVLLPLLAEAQSYRSSEAMAFGLASTYCASKGGLASIRSEDENDKMMSICAGVCCHLGIEEFGGTQYTGSSSQVWKWIDSNDTADFDKWVSGEPGNHGGSDQRHAIMHCTPSLGCHSTFQLFYGKWYDVDASRGQGNECYAVCNDDVRSYAGPIVRTKEGFESCSEDRCRSPGSDTKFNCWAGTEDERCTCSQGTAKLTGKTVVWEVDNRRYYEYSCCTDGSGVGEECGDCCTDWLGVAIGVLVGLSFVALCIIGVSVYICYHHKCCCFQQVPQQPVQGMGYQQHIQPAVVVGQVVMESNAKGS